MYKVLVLIFIPFLLGAQSFKRTLQKANSFYYKNNIYIYGYLQNKDRTDFLLYKVSNALSKTDSTSYELGKDKVENYLEITADTLHNYLNFYFQRSDSKNKATLIRLNDSLRFISMVQNFESTRINSLTSFEDEKFTFQNSTYIVRSSEDSLGKQYFLTRYDVTNFQKPFEYQSKWQFPFEKRNINTVHVFYADTNLLFVYVNVTTGTKSGQWILKLNNKTGELIHGTKLNHKGDLRHVLPTCFNYNKKTKELLAVGNIYTNQQINFADKTHPFLNLEKQNTFFFYKIDSVGDVVSRNEKIYPVILIANKTNLKQVFYYHLKIKEIKRKSDTEYSAYCSIYKSTGQELLFLYGTGFYFNFSISEMGLEINFEKLLDNLSILQGFVTNDPKDINGKMEITSTLEFDKLLMKWPMADVEKYFGKDDLGLPKWILNKSDVKTGKSTFYLVNMGKKGLESKVLLESSKYDHPSIYKISNEKLLFFNFDAVNSTFEISPGNW